MSKVQKIGYVVPMSRELYEDTLTIRDAYERWQRATPEEREQWMREAADLRAAKRADTGHVALTVEALADRMGWTLEYAEHLVQPYCSCGPDSDGGWWYCEHADDLGLRP